MKLRAILLLLDKFGDEHDVQFSAQDDDWETEYHVRTGILQAVFGTRWEALRKIPNTNREEYSVPLWRLDIGGRL